MYVECYFTEITHSMVEKHEQLSFTYIQSYTIVQIIPRKCHIQEFTQTLFTYVSNHATAIIHTFVKFA
jgi:hypothetical protein